MRFVNETQSLPASTTSTGPKILAAGLWRCATSSLQTAFESPHLNPPLGPSMHGAYIMPSNHRLKLCCQACRSTNTAERRALLHELFNGYNASSDFPGMAFVDDLLEMYPDMQVVLNRRKSAQAWETSVRGSLRFFSTWRYLACMYWVGQSYWHHQLYQAYFDLARRRWGIKDVFTVEAYETHNAWVKELCAAKGKEVVEWEPGMGWEPLCKMVGKEVPKEGFPNINESEAIKALTRFLIIRGLKAWAVVICTPAVLLFALYWAASSSSNTARLSR